MQQEERMIAENVSMARNLYQSEFVPQVTPTQEIEENLTNRING